MLLPTENQFSMRCTVHRPLPPDYEINLIRRRMRESLANQIIHKKMTEEIGEYSTTYGMDVYVITADELSGLIQREAESLMRWINL